MRDEQTNLRDPLLPFARSLIMLIHVYKTRCDDMNENTNSPFFVRHRKPQSTSFFRLIRDGEA
jgi:hypothetical protein